jgi:hypothetical protein
MKSKGITFECKDCYFYKKDKSKEKREQCVNCAYRRKE